MNITWSDILNGISCALGYIVFYMLCRNMKIIRWARQKTVRVIVCIFIVLIFNLVLMDIIRGIGINGTYYTLLNGFFEGVLFGVAISIFSHKKRKIA